MLAVMSVRFKNSTSRLALLFPSVSNCFKIYADAQLRDCASAAAIGIDCPVQDLPVAGTSP